MIIDPHYTGFGTYGHGGASGGRFAELVEADAAAVRFHRPIPVGVDLAPVADGDAVTIVHHDERIATVRRLDGPLAVAPFSMPSTLDVERAERSWLDSRDGVHVAPTCFACGHERLVGGLALRPGPVGDAGVHACRWRPEGVGRLPSWLVWAALDCPTGFPAMRDLGREEAAMTGELAVQILEPVHAGSTYRILSRLVAAEGRRRMTVAALYRADGRRCAVANATWLSVPLAACDPQGRLGSAA
jgi:hypothetical protein